MKTEDKNPDAAVFKIWRWPSHEPASKGRERFLLVLSKDFLDEARAASEKLGEKFLLAIHAGDTARTQKLISIHSWESGKHEHVPVFIECNSNVNAFKIYKYGFNRSSAHQIPTPVDLGSGTISIPETASRDRPAEAGGGSDSKIGEASGKKSTGHEDVLAAAVCYAKHPVSGRPEPVDAMLALCPPQNAWPWALGARKAFFDSHHPESVHDILIFSRSQNDFTRHAKIWDTFSAGLRLTTEYGAYAQRNERLAEYAKGCGINAYISSENGYLKQIELKLTPGDGRYFSSLELKCLNIFRIPNYTYDNTKKVDIKSSTLHEKTFLIKEPEFSEIYAIRVPSYEHVKPDTIHKNHIFIENIHGRTDTSKMITPDSYIYMFMDANAGKLIFLNDDLDDLESRIQDFRRRAPRNQSGLDNPPSVRAADYFVFNSVPSHVSNSVSDPNIQWRQDMLTLARSAWKEAGMSERAIDRNVKALSTLFIAPEDYSQFFALLGTALDIVTNPVWEDTAHIEPAWRQLFNKEQDIYRWLGKENILSARRLVDWWRGDGKKMALTYRSRLENIRYCIDKVDGLFGFRMTMGEEFAMESRPHDVWIDNFLENLCDEKYGDLYESIKPGIKSYLTRISDLSSQTANVLGKFGKLFGNASGLQEDLLYGAFLLRRLPVAEIRLPSPLNRPPDPDIIKKMLDFFRRLNAATLPEGVLESAMQAQIKTRKFLTKIDALGQEFFNSGDYFRTQDARLECLSKFIFSLMWRRAIASDITVGDGPGTSAEEIMDLDKSGNIAIELLEYYYKSKNRPY